MAFIKMISKILALPLLALVVIYQKTISMDHAAGRILHPYGFCKFYPSCSEYARQVLVKEGVIGISKIFKRLASCTPNSAGGFDYPYSQ